MAIRMLTEFRRIIDEQDENFNRVWKYKKEPIRGEEYNNLNKKYARGNQ